MELCEADVARMEQKGYRREDFTIRGADGIPRLRNAGEYCFFYDHEQKRCREYACRPLGCQIYPVNVSVDGEIVIDELCPESGTLSRREMDAKGRQLRDLLKIIKLEAERHEHRD